MAIALRAALTAQAEAFEHVILANTTNEGVVRLCERVLHANGAGPERWGLDAAPGSTAAGSAGSSSPTTGRPRSEIAIKMALQAPQQQRRGRTLRGRNSPRSRTATTARPWPRLSRARPRTLLQALSPRVHLRVRMLARCAAAG